MRLGVRKTFGLLEAVRRELAERSPQLADLEVRRILPLKMKTAARLMTERSQVRF